MDEKTRQYKRDIIIIISGIMRDLVGLQEITIICEPNPDGSPDKISEVSNDIMQKVLRNIKALQNKLEVK